MVFFAPTFPLPHPRSLPHNAQSPSPSVLPPEPQNTAHRASVSLITLYPCPTSDTPDSSSTPSLLIGGGRNNDTLMLAQ